MSLYFHSFTNDAVSYYHYHSESNPTTSYYYHQQTPTTSLNLSPQNLPLQ